MKSNEQKAYQKAGALAALCLFLGIVALFIPSGGVGIVVSPFSICLGIFVGWRFWYKGKFGSETERLWVEENF